jgi:hypothetical protein
MPVDLISYFTIFSDEEHEQSSDEGLPPGSNGSAHILGWIHDHLFTQWFMNFEERV